MKVKSGVLNYRNFIIKQHGEICSGTTAFLSSKNSDFFIVISPVTDIFLSCSMNITGVLFLFFLDPASYKCA